MSVERIRVWLDCDPGHDDVFAIIFAALHPRMELVGISTVFGNQTVDNTTTNALRTLNLLKRLDIPVYKGAYIPLRGHAAFCPAIHGESGLDLLGHSWPELPPNAKPAVGSPLDAIAAAALDPVSASRPLHLVVTGCCTNAAMFFSMHPHAAAALGGVSIMGGAVVGGNTGPYAEFNIQRDPDAAAALVCNYVPAHPSTKLHPVPPAAARVGDGEGAEGVESFTPFPPSAAISHDIFRGVSRVPHPVTAAQGGSGMATAEAAACSGGATAVPPSTSTPLGPLANSAVHGPSAPPQALPSLHVHVPVFIVPLDLTHTFLATKGVMARFHSETLQGLLRFFEKSYADSFGFEDGPPVHDVCAMAALVVPHLFTSRAAHVAVETSNPLTKGQTIVDYDDPSLRMYRSGIEFPLWKNCRVAIKVNVAALWEEVIETFGPINKSGF